MPAPVLSGAVYVWTGAGDKIHVANERAFKTLCGRMISAGSINTAQEARAHAISPGAVPLTSICRRCAEHYINLLEAMGLIKNGVYQH